MIERYEEGFEIQGRGDIVLRLHPSPSSGGAVYIEAIALPAATGFAASIALNSTLRRSFEPFEITLSDTRLDCFAPSEIALSSYRQGFMVELDAGMIQELRSVLPRVQALSRATHDLLTFIARARERGGAPSVTPDTAGMMPHLRHIACASLAGALLDGRDYAASVETVFQDMRDEKHEDDTFQQLGLQRDENDDEDFEENEDLSSFRETLSSARVREFVARALGRATT